MATANFSIKPEDGWVAITSGTVAFIRVNRYPASMPFYITSGSSAPSANDLPATGSITITGLPVADETVTIGANVYTFKASAASAFQVTIGGTGQITLDNLLAKITANETLVTGVKSGTTIINLTAVSTGTAGNAIVLTESATNIVVSGSGTLAGGTATTRGFLVEDNDDFMVNVSTTNVYYARTTNPRGDTNPLRIDVFTL